MAVTGLYAALMALLFLALSFRVVAKRGAPGGPPLGDGGDSQMLRYIRGHANFAEYVPLALLLLALLEYRGGAGWLLHALGIALLAGRLLHAYAFFVVKHSMPARVLGMVLTFTVLLVPALLHLFWSLVG